MASLTLVIYFDNPKAKGYPFTNPNYFESYADFSKLCQKYYVNLYFARSPQSYQGKMRFSHGWRINNYKLEKINHPIKADIIYQKGIHLVCDKDDLVINNPLLGEIANNKLKTYQVFKKFMVKSYLITRRNYQSVLDKITTKKIVIKPVVGSEGIDISIINKKDFVPSLIKNNKAYLAQRFLDTSTGIPGLIKGLHDLRIIVFNGKIRLSYIRQPKPGSLLANIAQGGSLKVINIHRVPLSAKKIFRVVDKKFKSFFPRIYSIDLGYEKNHPYIYEINSQPGLPYKSWDKFDHYYSKFHRYLLDVILSAKNE